MIKQVMVVNDQVVEAGEPLVQLDPESYQLAVNKAEADLEEVAQTLGAGLASVAAAEVALVSTKTNLTYVTRQAQRVFDLEDEGLLSELSGDTMRTKVEQAKIAVSDAEAKLLEEKTGVGVSGEENPRYQSALSALQQAQLDLKSTTMVSPAYDTHTDTQRHTR